MQEFLHALLLMPTLVFTAMLGVSLVYWILIIVGAADLNPFDGAEGATEGAHGALEGAAHGVADAAAHGVAEGIGDSAAAIKGVSAFTEALAFLGLTKVPITISFSLFSLFAWFLSYATRHALQLLPSWLAALAATGVAVAGGFLVTSLMTRPLSTLFKERRRPGGRGLVGRTVKITTERVDEQRGQGEIDDGAGGITVSIRCGSGVLLRGDEAVIIEADAEAGIYWVEPSRVLLPDTVAEIAAIPHGSTNSKRE